MRWVFSLLLIFALAVGLALFVEFNHGNVAIFWPPYRVDISVNMVVLGLIVGFLLLHLFLIATARLFDLPQRVSDYRLKQSETQGISAFKESVLALFEGRFGRAERLAEVAIKDTRFKEVAALVAARSAHRLRDFERRDRWLAASKTSEQSGNAQLMTLAELAVEERSESGAKDAIAAVTALHARGARHIHAQRTALRAYELTENWQEVIRLTRLLYKRSAIHPAASRGLLTRSHRALLKTFDEDLPGLKKHWSQMSAAEQRWPEVVEAASLAFSKAGDHSQAVKLITSRLDGEFSGPAADLYASLVAIPAKERLVKLEALLARIGPDFSLLRALGRVCFELQLWGKAQDYLQRSLASQPTVDAYLVLAEVYQATDRVDLANDAYRAAAKFNRA